MRASDGIKTLAEGNADDCSTAATYLVRCINAGNVKTLREAITLKKYLNRGDLIWTLILKVLPTDANAADSEWARLLKFLRHPRQQPDDITLDLWQLRIEIAMERSIELAGDDEDRKRKLSDEATVAENLTTWTTPADRSLPSWVDTYMIETLRTKKTLDEVFAQLAKYDVLADGSSPGTIAALGGTSKGSNAPSAACSKHPTPKHTNAECRVQQAGSSATDKRRTPATASNGSTI